MFNRSFINEFNKYFLNPQMIELKNNAKYSEIISMRKNLIMEAEQKFVESYDIIYGEVDMSEE